MVSGIREVCWVEGVTRETESLRSDERGAVYVEYLVLASMVTITGAAAVVTLGVPLYNLFRYVEMMILLPVP
jgi:Flp pilus assembly pilin Flp